MITPPNKSPEPTAVGAGRSAVAVHVASRRWLSFFREATSRAMSDLRPDQTPKTQPASAGGPSRPPKKTARGLGDGFPDDFFGPGVDIVDLQARDRWQAIEELVSHLVATRKIQSQHRDSLAESVRKRESSMSTGIGLD